MSSLTIARAAGVRRSTSSLTYWEDHVSRRRARWATGLGLGTAAVTFYLLLLDFSTDVQRQATGLGFGSQFFDLQATAIRHGHLWVPGASLGIEGFKVHGHSYLYFGIFPALLRIPVQLVTDSYDGHLTVLSMAVAWLVFAVMAGRLFWLIRECLGRPRHLSRVEATLSGVFLAALCGGSVVVFDASLPWAYHEVYLWSMAAVTGSLYWILRLVREPTLPGVVWLFLFLLAASLTRTTGGWAVCLATLAVGLWVCSGRLHPGRRALGVGVIVTAAAPWLLAIAVNYAKFRHPFLFPLQDQEWTRLNAHRREALAANGGSLVGLQFLPSSLVNYFSPTGIRFTGYFPWVSFPARPARGYGAMLDQSYRTGSVTTFAPYLFLLTLASIPMLFRRLKTQEARGVRLIWIGALLVTGGVMGYGYIAYRYTSEFIPVLLVGGAVATHVLGGWLTPRLARPPRAAARLLMTGAVLLAAFGLFANTAVAHYTSAVTYRGASLEKYVGLQTTLSGGTASFSRLVHASSDLPTGGRADDLWIRGDCDALYLNTGETAEPWVLVQERDTALQVQVAANAQPGTYELMRSTYPKLRTVSLEISRDRQARMILKNEGGFYRGYPFDLPPQASIRVGSRNLSELGYAEISSLPGGFTGYLRTWDWTNDWVSEPSVLQPSPLIDSPGLRARGLTVRPAPTLPLPLCHRVARAAHVDLAAAAR